MRFTSAACFGLAGVAVAQNSTIVDCSCGYSLSRYNNSYFPFLHYVDFTNITSLDDLANHSLTANIGQGNVGSVSPVDGTTCYGAVENYVFTPEGLNLIVPGGQMANGGNVTGAELDLDFPILFGVITAEYKLSPIAGTCQSVFTYTDDSSIGFDEQDIEILGSSIFNASTNSPPGVQFTNYDPTDSTDQRNSQTIDPFTFDPTAGFNNYTIAWLRGNTTYYINGVSQLSPPVYSSVNPSVVIMNHWTNGDPNFTEGPPNATAILVARKLTVYYATNETSQMPATCTQAEVCTV